MDVLTDDALLLTLILLSPIELIRLRAASLRVKFLCEQTLRLVRRLVIEHRGFIPIFHRQGETHLVNSFAVSIKQSELLFCIELLKHCYNVKEIRIKAKKLDIASFEAFCTTIQEQCSQLKSFALSSDRFNSTYIDIDLQLLAISARTLKSVSFGDGITEVDITKLLSEADGLNRLELQLSSDKIKGTCLEVLGPNVTEVEILGSVYWWELTSTIMQHLAHGQQERAEKKIKKLQFRCKGIKQQTISSITEHHNFDQLETLSFRRPNFYSAEVRCMDLSSIANLTKLKQLRLEVFSFMDDDALIKIISSCKLLTHLSVKVPISNFHPLVTEASLSLISQRLPQLFELTIQNVRVSENCIAKFSQLKCLNRLWLQDVNMNGTVGLSSLLNDAIQLESLRLKQCFNLSRMLLTTTIGSFLPVVYARRSVQVTLHQETIYDPPAFQGVPKNLKLSISKIHFA